MKKYEVVNDCIRMPFDRRMFRKGEVIELEDSVVPGANFKLLGKAPKEEPKKEETLSLSGLQKKQAGASKPKTGFAAKGKDDTK